MDGSRSGQLRFQLSAAPQPPYICAITSAHRDSRTEGSMATHAFLSHVTEDAKLVARLKTDLDADEPISWLARERLMPGDDWMFEIRRAIAEGTFFIACFSAASAARERSVMNKEVLLAIDELQQR